jgi:hypothetical protein
MSKMKQLNAVARLEEGYRMLNLMAAAGNSIDEPVLQAMNATLSMVLAIENGNLNPKNIGENPFLKFERTKLATINWLCAKFETWCRNCYPMNDAFLALEYFMNSIKYSSAVAISGDNEIANVLAAINYEMAMRKNSQSRIDAKLTEESLLCVCAALSIESAFF